MTSSRSFRKYGLIIVLAIGLSLLSLIYVRPANCQRLCNEPEFAPCPSGACRFGEQRAGFPLPIVVDAPGGGSPTGGWGKLGPEDMPNPLTFLMDVAFYAALVWIVWFGIELIGERKKITGKILLPLAAPLAVILIGALMAIRLTLAMHPAQDLSKTQTALIGNWRLISEEFIFGFFEDGRLLMSHPGSTERDLGMYEWVNDRAIRISFAQSYPLAEPEAALCNRMPAFLKSQCHSNSDKSVRAPSTAYPFPVEPTLVSAYPAPTLIPAGVSQIDVTLNVDVNGNVLTLSDPDGGAQVFERVLR